MKKFWMVYVPGFKMSNQEHSTLESAEKEAALIVVNRSTSKAVVLEAVTLIESEMPPVVKTELTE